MHKDKVEAILFSSGRKMDIEEISKLCRANTEDVTNALKELQKEYEEKNSSLMLIDEGTKWKIEVKEEHLPIVSKIVSETEVNKAVLETLAVIAFKYPVRQNEIIKIRNNKGYDHLRELEEAGYITRQRYGRTKLIKLTQKFFDYFDLPKEKLKEKFETFEGLASAIEQKEKEIESIGKKEEKKTEQMEAEGKRKEIEQEPKVEETTIPSTKPQITLISDSQPKITEDKQTIGNLEVYDNPEPQEIQEEQVDEANEEEQDEEQEKEQEEVDIEEIKEKGFQIKTEEEKVLERLEKKIEKKADHLLNPKKEEEKEEE